MYLEEETAEPSEKYKNIWETKKHWKNPENLIIKQKHVIN